MRVFIILAFLSVHWSLLLAQTGVVWSQTASVASNQFGNMHPRVTIDGSGEPMVIWGNSDTKSVYFSRRSGNGFTAPLKLNPDTIPVFAASWGGPDLASHGDTVYVVFKETPEDVNGIYLVHSFDGGANFSAPARVDAIGSNISRFPAVTTDADGHPMVAFMKFNPGWGSARYVLAKSDDYGNSFGPDVLGSGFSGGTVCDCCPATVTTSGNTTALLYRDNLNNLRNTWAGISFNGGSSFTDGIEIDKTDWTVNACPASGPDGIISGDRLYAVFMSAASGKALCYRSRSSLSNLLLETTEPLTGDFAGLALQNFPRMAASDNAATVVWKQTVNSNAQLAVQFTDSLSNGFPTGHEVLVDNNVVNADVAMMNGKIYVVWEAGNDGTVKFKTGTYATVSSLLPDATQGRSLRISPNPVAENELNVFMEDTENQLVRYTIYSTTGSILLQGEQTLENRQTRIDVSPLPKGYYWISLQSGQHNAYAAFIR